MAFYQPQLTPAQNAEITNELVAMSSRYKLSKHDLLQKITECLGLGLSQPSLVVVPMPTPAPIVPQPMRQLAPQPTPHLVPQPVPTPKPEAKGPARKGNRWTVEEEQIMASSFKAGVSCEDIAKKLERTPIAIASRMALYTARRSTNKSLNDIVKEFGLTSLTVHELSIFQSYLEANMKQQAGAAPAVTMENIPATLPSPNASMAPSPTTVPESADTQSDSDSAPDPE
jgi:hypothetical protein